MIIVCKYNNDKAIAKKNLTVGKEYKVIEYSQFCQYLIKDDNGDESWWNEERFNIKL